MDPSALTPEEIVSLGKLGAVAALSLAAVGSALGTGAAGAAAIGAWKKCYAQSKAAPFLLLAFIGAPLSQTIYGMILMFSMTGKAADGASYQALLGGGIFAGLAIGASAWMQGRAGAGGSHALAETGQGFTNYLAALGVIETVAIFVMVFVIIAL
jgi:V/A-type H+-transporting ATPase subunit K